MATLFQPFSYSGYTGQVIYPNLDYLIDDSTIKYLQNVRQETLPQITIEHTGFVSKVFRIESSTDYNIRFNFTFSNKTPRSVVNNVRSFIRGCNGAGIGVRFFDRFINGSTSTPVTYTGRFGNTIDCSDSNVLVSMLTFDFLVWGEY